MLYEHINQDIWGDGCKIVPNVQGQRTTANAAMRQTIGRSEGLVSQARSANEIEISNVMGAVLITKEELQGADWKLKPAIAQHPEAMLKVFNRIYQSGGFSNAWKVARLVLLRKLGKDVQHPNSFRFLCLLNSIGKTLEHVVYKRVEETLERNGHLLQEQFGFRRSRSTEDNIRIVMEIADGARVCAITVHPSDSGHQERF